MSLRLRTPGSVLPARHVSTTCLS